ncbi:phosphoesterase [Nocardia sp. SYP-A9097]|uniref:metallophosphoesterase n=1 Tax=Nocardia sp. SYP-A9097 TaxID=2663237 RepID=UPI00129A7945|nr:metallophosphoesterase [Nocardia sp. SYP-A9097]MRH90739.1 phosphoesterase [Nocardia sp. SYP-A9097]
MQQPDISPPSGPVLGRRELLAGAAGAAGALAGIGLLGLTPAQAVPVAAGVTKFDLPNSDQVRVLVTGDAGTGTLTQFAVADAARAYHAREPFSMAVGLGDNLYYSGPSGEHDDQFNTKFETPNAGLDFPWAMVLGNHDNSSILPGDGGWLARGNYEVAYHANSARWWMPSRYYSLRVPQQNPVVEFFILDLNPLASYIPQILDPYWAVDGQFMNDQRAWLDKALAESPAKWKIVCTHHPYLNNGSHGAAGHYDGLPAPMNGMHAKTFFEDHVVGKANFILSGHDHTLQVFEPTTESKGTRQLISGASSQTGKSQSMVGSSGGTRYPALFESFDKLGFMVLDLTPSSVNLRVVTVDPATDQSSRVFDQRLV